MGLVINPIAYRIGYSKTWTDAWYLHRINYPVFVHNVIAVKSLVFFILFRYFPSRFSKWVYSHLSFYYLNNKFFINIYIYDANNQYLYWKLVKRHKKRWFKKVRYVRYWTKKYLLDKKYLFQRWILLLQQFHINVEELQLDDKRFWLPKRELRKIDHLKWKYGNDWQAKEDLYIWKFPIFSTANGAYNKLGFPILNQIFKRVISPALKKIKRKKKNHLLFESANKIVKSYKLLYFFFSFVDKIFKFSPVYPRVPFNRFVIKFIFRFFFIWFVYKPFFSQLSKMLEWIVLYLNIDSKVKIFLLDNHHLTASFISRFILIALRMKFDYRDTMIPIRKSLNRQMYVRRLANINEKRQYGWNMYSKKYAKLESDRRLFYKSLIGLSKLNFYKYIHTLKYKKRTYRFFRRKKYIYSFNLKRNLDLFFNKFNKIINSNIYKLHVGYKKFNLYKKWSLYKSYKKIKIRALILKKFIFLFNFIKKNYLLKFFFDLNNFFYFNFKYYNFFEKFLNFLTDSILYKRNDFLYNKIIFLNNLKLYKKRLKKKYKIIIYYFFFYFNGYSKPYISFPVNNLSYRHFVNKIFNFERINIKKRKKSLNTDLEIIPFKNKLKRIEILDNHRSFLYGYKFHFVGRFTRKQKAASLWFLKGSNPVSSFYANVDYGFYTNIMRYSTCSLKVWLYKSQKVPIRGFRFI